MYLYTSLASALLTIRFRKPAANIWGCVSVVFQRSIIFPVLVDLVTTTKEGAAPFDGATAVAPLGGVTGVVAPFNGATAAAPFDGATAAAPLGGVTEAAAPPDGATEAAAPLGGVTEAAAPFDGATAAAPLGGVTEAAGPFDGATEAAAPLGGVTEAAAPFDGATAAAPLGGVTEAAAPPDGATAAPPDGEANPAISGIQLSGSGGIHSQWDGATLAEGPVL